MTEPDVAPSDPTDIATRIERDGVHYIVNGRKWWITGAMNPNAKIFIVIGKTDPTAARHRQQRTILVPRDTPGLRIKRGLTVFGYDDNEHGGHAELEFRDVRVPAENLIGNEGDGFAIAQARLGPGRIHHCMRFIGVAERVIELMCKRASERDAFGKRLSEQGVIRDTIPSGILRSCRYTVRFTHLVGRRTCSAAAESDLVGCTASPPHRVHRRSAFHDKAVEEGAGRVHYVRKNLRRATGD